MPYRKIGRIEGIFSKKKNRKLQVQVEHFGKVEQ